MFEPVLKPWLYPLISPLNPLLNPFAALVFIAYVTAALYVLLYRKQGARHRPRVAWLAWLLLVVLGGSAIELVMRPAMGARLDALAACREILLCLFVLRARGDVARLIHKNDCDKNDCNTNDQGEKG